MTNIGRPSQGCSLCRKRKLKCDEQKPSCARCAKIGQTCPGYENPDKWLFVDRRGKPVKPATKGTIGTPERDPVIQKSPMESSTSTTTRANTPILPAPIDYDTQALCLYLVTWTANSDIACGDPGHMDFLPSLLSTSSSDSCLHKATAALALRNMINRRECLSLTGKVTETLIGALTSTNQALADPSLRLQDETLAAVYLLGMYESMNPKAVLGGWKSHITGALQLLRLRGHQQFETSQGRQLFRLVHTPILIKSFRAAEEPPEESQHMIQLFQQYHVPNYFSGQMTSYFYKVVMLRAKLHKLLHSKHRSNNLLYDDDSARFKSISLLIAQGQALDSSSNFSAWAADDEYWRLRRKHVISTNGSELTIFYWRSFWAMSQWIRGWTARMYLYITLLNALDNIAYLDPLSLDDLANAAAISNALEAKLLETIDKVLRSIDFALSDIDSNGHLAQYDTFMTDPAATAVGPVYIFYALEVIMTCMHTTPDQRTVALKAARRIGRERGMGRLLSWQYGVQYMR